MAGWLVGWLAGWLVGWLVAGFYQMLTLPYTSEWPQIHMNALSKGTACCSGLSFKGL